MKVKRYIREYANSKIKEYKALSAKYPNNVEMFTAMIDSVNRAVSLTERGFITGDECIRLILESASASY